MAAIRLRGIGGRAASAWEPSRPDSSAANADEDQRAGGVDPAPDERLRRGQHRRRARGVVFRAVVDRVPVDRRPDTEVIVVAADQHGFAARAARARASRPSTFAVSERRMALRTVASSCTPSGTALNPRERPAAVSAARSCPPGWKSSRGRVLAAASRRPAVTWAAPRAGPGDRSSPRAPWSRDRWRSRWCGPSGCRRRPAAGPPRSCRSSGRSR